MEKVRPQCGQPSDRGRLKIRSDQIRSPLYRFRDIAGYLSKVADSDPPHLHLAPQQGVTPVEFRGYLWHQKTGVPGVSCGVVCVILRFAVLVEHRLVTDTDGRTQGHGHAQHRAVKTTGDDLKRKLAHSDQGEDARVLLRYCLQCFDAVGWATGRASGL